MPDTPTYANLLTRLFSGDAEERHAVIDHLKGSKADRVAAEDEIRSRLKDSFPWSRLIAADAVFRVYDDPETAADAVAGVFRAGDPAAAAAAGVIRGFGPHAVPLLLAMSRHTPEVFAAQNFGYYRWAAHVTVRSGAEGLAAWQELLGADDAGLGLVVGLAETAGGVDYDLTPAVAPLKARLGAPGLQVAAGAALWRVTWRVNREWLAALTPDRPELRWAGLGPLLLEVLTEHLGRRPDLAGLVRGALAAYLSDTPERAADEVRRMARVGACGWGVLLPMLHPARPDDPFPVPDSLREAIYRHAIRHPAVLPLVHHHAHGVVAAAAADGSAGTLIAPAAEALSHLGAAAGTAVPDLLNLVVRIPSTGPVVAAALPKLAAGFPNTVGSLTRTLSRVRNASYFGPDHVAAFAALAGVVAELDLDAGPGLIENTALDPRVVELLLQQPAWKDAPPEARARHARALADALGSSRAEVRLRAAEALRHYRAELPGVWPALVAVLAGPDEKVALSVLPYFRNLEPAADGVTTELVLLFREKNPHYAARAVVALWRLGRMPRIGPELRRAVETDTADENAWGWVVLRGVVGRVSQAHGLLANLSELFAASPAAVAERVAAMVNPPEPAEDRVISQHVPRAGDPAAPVAVNWDGVHAVVGPEGPGGVLLFVALMCEYGFGPQATFAHKIWMIKNHREMTRTGLAESKGIVERVLASLEQPGKAHTERQAAVREFFAHRTQLPAELLAMTEHRLGWVRWAGLELADAWGLTPEQSRAITEERVWDANPRVRERALRMVRG